MIRRYRPLYKDVEAVQLCWANWNAVCEILGDILNENNPAYLVSSYADTCGEPGPQWIEIRIPIVGYERCSVIAHHGDWIVRDLYGIRQFHVLPPSMFEESYGLLEEGDVAAAPVADLSNHRPQGAPAVS